MRKKTPQIIADTIDYALDELEWINDILDDAELMRILPQRDITLLKNEFFKNVSTLHVCQAEMQAIDPSPVVKLLMPPVDQRSPAPLL